jgi:hypothetical protein
VPDMSLERRAPTPGRRYRVVGSVRRPTRSGTSRSLLGDGVVEVLARNSPASVDEPPTSHRPCRAKPGRRPNLASVSEGSIHLSMQPTSSPLPCVRFGRPFLEVPQAFRPLPDSLT